MNKSRSAMLILILTTLLWGGNFVFGKFLVTLIPPWTLAALRWTVAVAVLLPWAWWQERLSWPQVQNYRHSLLLMGISGVFLFNSLVYLALKYTTPTNAALIGSANPVVIAALAYLLFRERLNRRQLLGLGLSLTGVVWVVSQGSWQHLSELGLNWGDLTMVLNLFIWTLMLYPVAVWQQPLQQAQLVGGLLVAGGVYLTNRG